MIFYLKVNRNVEYTLSNLRAWIDAIAWLDNSKIIIISDNKSLTEVINERIVPGFDEYDISIMGSDRDTMELKAIAEAVTVPHWYNCACSHLTTFFHSVANGYKAFWNIDADDTFFCASKERLAEMLAEAQKYADENGIGLFSLDMWTSRNQGFAWSFGVTYTRNHIDWINTMMTHRNDPELINHIPGHTKNLDLYFTYLRDVFADLKIETFCFQNLRFVHYGNDMYRNPIGAGFYHWKDGFLRFPLLYYFYGSKALGKYEIPHNVVVLDVGIEDRDSYSLIGSFFHKYAVDAEEFYSDRPYYEAGRAQITDIHPYSGKNVRFVLFGCGNEGRATLKYLGKDRVICFVDNGKHGMTVDDKPVISFDELVKMDFRSFSLIVTTLNGYSEITKQLEDNGIYNYSFLPLP